MYIGSIDVLKDGWDYFCILCTFISSVAVPLLIWYFGASRVEKIKERQRQIAMLNYLTIAINEFNNYYIALLNAFINKEKIINNYFGNKNNETYKPVFIILKQLPYNLELNFSDYNFTADGNPQILRLLFKYKHYVDALLPLIDDFNCNLTNLKNLSEGELHIRLQYDFLDEKIPNTKFLLYLILYILKCLSDEIQRYNNEFMQSELLYITIPENTVEIYKEAEKVLDNKFSSTAPNWRSDFIFNSESRRLKVGIWTKINNIFINPQ